jgi:GAF domain-containing protein
MTQDSNAPRQVDGPTASAFTELSRMLHDDQPLSTTLQRVAELARDTIPELADVSITLVNDDQPSTVVFTGPLAVDLDERQYADGYGPCTDAAASGHTITVDTSSPAGASYPAFADLAASRGITHVLSVALPIPQRTVGALNMYSNARAPFAAASVGLAETFAGFAAVAITNAVVYRDALDLAAHLRTAMQTRAVIEQAKGIIVARNHCTTEEAFKALGQMSQRTHVKLRDVATTLVTDAENKRVTTAPR